MKIITFFCLYAVLFFGMLANSHGHDNRQTTVIEKTISNNTYNGTALAIAMSQSHFDMGTYELQGSVGVGSYQGSEAVSFAIGKRYKDILINGSIGSENGKTGYGAGITFRF